MGGASLYVDEKSSKFGVYIINLILLQFVWGVFVLLNKYEEKRPKFFSIENTVVSVFGTITHVVFLEILIPEVAAYYGFFDNLSKTL